MSSAEPIVELETLGHIGTARLVRGQILPDDLVTLARFVTSVAENPDIRVLVLTGTGDTFAVSGRDPNQTISAAEGYQRTVGITRALIELDTPLVVAVNGAVANAGLTIALLGDIIVAERQVTFSDPHVRLGVSSATGPYLWPPAMGFIRAKRYVMTGDAMSSGDAERFGLVTEVVDEGRSLARATEYARQLAELSPTALRATKRSFNQWLRMAYSPVLEPALGLEFLNLRG